MLLRKRGTTRDKDDYRWLGWKNFKGRFGPKNIILKNLNHDLVRSFEN